MSILNKEILEGNVALKFSDNTVSIKGNLDCKDPGYFMGPFFDEIHEYLILNKLKKVLVDITELKFLNSSGIRELVGWILKLDRAAEEDKYSITFLCNSDYLWQESSITTIVFLNRDILFKEDI